MIYKQMAEDAAKLLNNQFVIQFEREIYCGPDRGEMVWGTIPDTQGNYSFCQGVMHVLKDYKRYRKMRIVKVEG